MLDNEGQVKAFQILSRDGLIIPESVSLSRQSEVLAKDESDKVSMLVVDGSEYPASIAPQIKQIIGFKDELADIQNIAAAHGISLSPHITPSALQTLSIGWSCCVKGYGLAEDTPFMLVAGMADTLKPSELLASLESLPFATLDTAMKSINALITAGAGTAGTGSVGALPPPVVVPDNDISAIKEATDAYSYALDVAKVDAKTLEALTGKVNQSVKDARNGLDCAVSVALSNAIRQNEAMVPTLSLILPGGVLDALESQS